MADLIGMRDLTHYSIRCTEPVDCVICEKKFIPSTPGQITCSTDCRRKRDAQRHNKCCKDTYIIEGVRITAFQLKTCGKLASGFTIVEWLNSRDRRILYNANLIDGKGNLTKLGASVAAHAAARSKVSD